MAKELHKLISDKLSFQRQVLKAVQLLAGPVKATLGPDGLPILLERPGQTPLVTKDGVTVANSIFLQDPQLNTIVQAIKEVALNTNATAGDGTTTAILLTEAFISEAQPYLQTGAITPQALGDSLVQLTQRLIDKLRSWAILVNKDVVAVKNVAYISCNGDEEVAKVVTDAIDAVGVDGVITLEDGGASGTALRVDEGFAVKRGFGSLGPMGVMLINSQPTQEVIYQQPAILLYDGIVENVVDFLGGAISRLTCNAQRPIPIVVFAHDFTPPVLHTLFANVARGKLQCLPVKIPRLGSQYSQSQVLQDLATLTGGKVMQPGIAGFETIENAQSDFIGAAERIVSSRRETIVYNGKGDATEIADRAGALRVQAKDAPSEFDRDILNERLGRLVGGIAVISIGGTTDLEVKERHDRIEDALNATRVALEEGIVPGGGTALLKAFLHSIENDSNLLENSPIAVSILRAVCQSPLRQIVRNTGKRSADLIVEQVKDRLKRSKASNYGYNARLDVLVDDLVKTGIIDPVKVICTALGNAVSIASVLLRGGGSVVFQDRRVEEELPTETSGEQD